MQRFYLVRWLAVGVLLVSAVTMLAGCGRSHAPSPALQNEPALKAPVREKTLENQIAAVNQGNSNEVRLEQASLGPEQLALLAGLTQLRTLVLDAGNVRDEDVGIVATLTGLEHLRLRGSPLTDAGLTQLGRSQLHSLIILNLPQAKPTAIGLRELGRLPRLRQLRMAGRQIDDAAIDVLASWPALTSLHLIQPAITDRSLETIGGMDQLTSFYIDECPLSDAAWEELFRLRPKLHVHIDQSHHDLDPHADH